MADSDDDRSDAGSGDDEPGFDPTQDLEKMSDKERKKWEKNLRSWRIVIDFLFRHISIVTFKYNCFEREELTQFLISLEKAEGLRMKTKLKKGEVPEIHSFKSMRESADLLLQHKYINDANRIKRFLDIMGRMKGISMIAGGFLKALKKGKVKNLEKMKSHVEFWKGFCVRSYNYGELQFRNANSESFNELEKKFLVWPTVIRTSINLSQKFLKTASTSTGLDLLSADPRTMQAHMQAAEFVVASKIEENLFNRVAMETKSFLVGNPLITGQTASPVPDNAKNQWTMPDITDIDPGLLRPIADDGESRTSQLLSGIGISSSELQNDNSPNYPVKWEVPKIRDLDPTLLEPISDASMLLELPAEPPKEKKKGKKGKGKGKKGRSTSASSHKGGKKKKKKK